MVRSDWEENWVSALQNGFLRTKTRSSPAVSTRLLNTEEETSGRRRSSVNAPRKSNFASSAAKNRTYETTNEGSHPDSA